MGWLVFGQTVLSSDDGLNSDEEIIAQIIQQRGYLVIAALKALKVGHVIPSLWANFDPKDRIAASQPFVLVCETNEADQRAQDAVAEEICGHLPSWCVRYQRAKSAATA